MSPLHRVFGVLLLCLTLSTAMPAPASAQDAQAATIYGRVVHGLADEAFDPTTISVTLNVFEGVTGFDAESVTPNTDGFFEFSVTPSEDRSYFLGVEYQGARYSETLSVADLAELATIEVFDSTHDSSVLEFISYSVIVAGAVAKDGWVEIIERASIVNESGTTLIPDPAAEGPAMLSFLRFGLPPNAYNLDVRSSLVGGDILTVDRGFALTTPVVPTRGEPHLFEFVYRLNYDEPTLDLSRTMRFGATSFRYVVPADTGRPIAPQLDDLGATELNERFLRLLEGTNVEPGQAMELSIAELPMPSVIERISDSAGLWYVRYVAPGVVLAVLVLITVLNLRRRQALPQLGAGGDPTAVHTALMARLAEVEARFSAGRLSEPRYESYRDQIKEALIDLRVRSQYSGEELA